MDRSLDEIIGTDQKQDRSSRGRGNQGRRRDRDAPRKQYDSNRVDLSLDWVHDKFDDRNDEGRDSRPSRGGGRRGGRGGSPGRGATLTKVRVDNLHYDVTAADLEDLFGGIGPVSDVYLAFDRAGRSEGVAFITYTYLKDAHTSLREFDGANAKGQPIHLSLVQGRRERGDRNDRGDRSGRGGRSSLFDRVERPRDDRSLSPTSDRGNDDGPRRRRGGGGRMRRSDVSKPAPENIDRYVPGSNSPRRSGGDRGGRGRGRDRQRNTENGGRRSGARPHKTQEELDQEMDDYWGGNGGDKQADQQQEAVVAPAVTVTADDDIDMIE